MYNIYNIYIYIYIPIEQALKKYAVNTLQEDHVRAFSRKKILHKRVSGGLLLNVFSKTNTHLKLQIRPTYGIQVLHSLHGQFSGFHFLIPFLKVRMSTSCFSLSGTKFHILGLKF